MLAVVVVVVVVVAAVVLIVVAEAAAGPVVTVVVVVAAVAAAVRPCCYYYRLPHRSQSLKHLPSRPLRSNSCSRDSAGQGVRLSWRPRTQTPRNK